MATVGGNILEALDEHISVWEGRSKVATPQRVFLCVDVLIQSVCFFSSICCIA
jgi:hypothetical protein